MEVQQISYSDNKVKRTNTSVNINLYDKYLDQQTKNGITNFIKRLSYASQSKEKKS
jgi:hypothetical protein